MTLQQNGGVWASIVTYHPDLAVLRRLLHAVAPQVARVVVVDNASPNAARIAALLAEPAMAGVLAPLWLPQQQNLGVAAGHNLAVRRALAGGAGHLLLLDQDSLPAADMVATLRAALEHPRPDGRAVAAAGPVFHDDRYGHAPFIRLEGWRIARIGCPGARTLGGADVRPASAGEGQIVRADYLITSGSLVPRQAWETVGLLDESLFIDYVDIEWGLRARARGFDCLGVCAARLHHDLGDDAHSILGGRKIVPIHSPSRHYYLLRNGVRLLRRPEPSMRWKLNDAWRLLLKYGYYSLFARPRRAHFLAMSRGIRDGLLGRGGPLPGA